MTKYNDTIDASTGLPDSDIEGLCNHTYTELLEYLEPFYGSEPLIVTCQENISFPGLAQLIDRYAITLHRTGVRRGDTVALWSTNSIAWVAAYFAIVKIGAIACLVNNGLGASSVISQLDFVDTDFIILGPSKAALTEPDLPAHIVETLGVSPSHILSITALDSGDLTAEERGILNYIASEDTPERDATIIFTTGTSALPKAVLLSQRNILANAWGCCFHLPEFAGVSVCIALPLFHVFGLSIFFGFLTARCHFAIPELQKPEAIMGIASKMPLQVYVSVSALYAKLTETPGFAEHMTKHTIACVVGGGSLPPQRNHQLSEAFGAPLLNGYGMTECSAVITVPVTGDPEFEREHTVGRPIPNIEVAIVDSEGNLLPTGKAGEVLVKGPTVMRKYLKIPKDRQPFNAKGWLHTGDIGRIDENGYLHLEGRIKDIIITRGENISPLEIEEALSDLPEIFACQVLGLPHPEWGECIVACVIMATGATFEPESLKSRLRGRIDSIKIPTYFVPFEEFPTAANGKCNVQKLRGDAEAYIAAFA